MSSNIYYIEWNGAYTNKSYRLEVYGAGSAFVSPQYIKLNKHVISIDSFEWEFDELPFGINSNTNLKIKWYLDYLDNAELELMLLSPRVQYDLPTDVDSVPFETGNVYELYIDNVAVYRGVQLTDEAFGFDGSEVYEVEITSLAKHLTTCFDLKTFISFESHLNRLHTKITPLIYEYFQKLNYNTWRAIANITDKSDIKSNDDYHYSLWDIASMENWLKAALQFCSNAILRKTVLINFELPFADYYKQDYAGNQMAGMQLQKSSTYVVTYIWIKGKTVGGIFAYTKDSMGGTYATLYDLLSDWSQSEGYKYFLSPNGETIKPLQMFGKNPVVIDIDTDLVTLKSVKKVQYKQVTISLHEFTDNDVDNYRYNDGVPRNDKEIQTVLLWNNTPPKNDYTKKKLHEDDYWRCSAFPTNANVNGDLFISWEAIRQWNMYYFDTADILEEERAFRVHDFCRTITRTRDNTGTEAIGTEPSIASVNFDDVNNAGAYCLAVQVEHPKASMFKRFNTYFGMDKVAKLTMTMPFETNFNDIMSGANNVIHINLSDFRASLSAYPTEYHLTKVEFDIEKETFTIEAIGIMV